MKLADIPRCSCYTSTQHSTVLCRSTRQVYAVRAFGGADHSRAAGRRIKHVHLGGNSRTCGKRPSARQAVVIKAVDTTAAPNNLDPLTFEEVQAVAKLRGLCLYVRTFGPSWRVVCRDGSEDGPIRGVVTGWIVPFTDILHCETLQVMTRRMKGPEGERLRGGALGLGLLMGGATFSFGYSKGCKKAEILAINDDDITHAKLVRYYKYFGFVPVREVEGSGLGDVVDMMAWGGAGTRMDADIVGMLQRWAPAFRSKLQPQQGTAVAGKQVDEGKSKVPAT